MIVIVVDSDDELENRQAALQRALASIRENHLDANENAVEDQSTGGLAIKSLEAWLLSDAGAIQALLQVTMIDDLPDLLEDLPADSSAPLYAKNLLDNAIGQSSYLDELTSNKRELQIRWELGKTTDLSKVKSRCPQGHGTLVAELTKASLLMQERITP